MSRITALNKKGLSPAVVLSSVAEVVEALKDVHIVGITKDGEPICWSSGDLGSLSFAVTVLQDMAIKYLNGQIEEEYPGVSS